MLSSAEDVDLALTLKMPQYALRFLEMVTPTHGILCCAAKMAEWEVVDLCLKSGCVLDTKIMANAVWSGDVSVLEKFVAMGCPYDARSLSVAAMLGHKSIIRYLYSIKCPYSLSGGEPWGVSFHIERINATPLGTSIKFQRKSITLLLLELGAPRHAEDFIPVRELESLKWMLDHGWTVGRTVVDILTRAGATRAVHLFREGGFKFRVKRDLLNPSFVELWEDLVAESQDDLEEDSIV